VPASVRPCGCATAALRQRPPIAAACSQAFTGPGHSGGSVHNRRRQKMGKLSLALVTIALAATAPSAFASANDEQAPCIALFTSNQPAGDVGESASSNAKEARPLGLNVISFSARLRDCGD
jgi:hypothetical protein